MNLGYIQTLGILYYTIQILKNMRKKLNITDSKLITRLSLTPGQAMMEIGSINRKHGEHDPCPFGIINKEFNTR